MLELSIIPRDLHQWEFQRFVQSYFFWRLLWVDSSHCKENCWWRSSDMVESTKTAINWPYCKICFLHIFMSDLLLKVRILSKLDWVAGLRVARGANQDQVYLWYISCRMDFWKGNNSEFYQSDWKSDFHEALNKCLWTFMYINSGKFSPLINGDFNSQRPESRRGHIHQ